MKGAVIAIIAALVGAGAVVGFMQIGQRQPGGGTPTTPSTVQPQTVAPAPQPEPAPVLLHLGGQLLWREYGLLAGNVQVESVATGERFSFQILDTDGVGSDLSSQAMGFQEITVEIRRPHSSARSKPGELLWSAYAVPEPAKLDYQAIAEGKPITYTVIVPTEVLEQCGRMPNLLWFGRYGYGRTSFEITYVPGARLTKAEAEKNAAAVRWPQP